MCYTGWLYNGLKINRGKTEVLLLCTAQGCAKFQEICPEVKIILGSQNLPISTTCRNLGFWFDAQLSGRAHASQVTRKSMFNLKRLRRVRKQLDDKTTKTAIKALVHSQLDYDSSMPYICHENFPENPKCRCWNVISFNSLVSWKYYSLSEWSALAGNPRKH